MRRKVGGTAVPTESTPIITEMALITVEIPSGLLADSKWYAMHDTAPEALTVNPGVTSNNKYEQCFTPPVALLCTDIHLSVNGFVGSGAHITVEIWENSSLYVTLPNINSGTAGRSILSQSINFGAGNAYSLRVAFTGTPVVDALSAIFVCNQ